MRFSSTGCQESTCEICQSTTHKNQRRLLFWKTSTMAGWVDEMVSMIRWCSGHDLVDCGALCGSLHAGRATDQPSACYHTYTQFPPKSEFPTKVVSSKKDETPMETQSNENMSLAQLYLQYTSGATVSFTHSNFYTLLHLFGWTQHLAGADILAGSDAILSNHSNSYVESM